ncbi:MAG: endonuclease/exonuclease/phosphatase family protein, partial [Verrucomicrobiota bacterium]
MNKITLLFLISILPVISFAREEPRIEKPLVLLDQESRTEPYHENFIRICTWNIEWFPAGQRNGAEQATQWQLAAVANLISKIKPDILLTQETRNLASLKRLNENLNRPRYRSIASSWFYEENEGKTSMGDKIQQQCGILSRYPWENIREIDFAPLPNPRPTRGWLMAQFQINEEQVTIYNGHLKSNYGAKEESTRLQNYAKRESAIVTFEVSIVDGHLFFIDLELSHQPASSGSWVR